MTAQNIDRIIEMAWDDHVPFETIELQFGIPEKEVIRIMRNELKQSSFQLWRKRVTSSVSKKHPKKQYSHITYEY